VPFYQFPKRRGVTMKNPRANPNLISPKAGRTFPYIFGNNDKYHPIIFVVKRLPLEASARSLTCLLF
jgi:hypothetical protein